MIIELIRDTSNPWLLGLAATIDALVYLWAIFCLFFYAQHLWLQRKEDNQAIMAREKTLSKNIKAAIRARGGRPIKYHGSCYSEAGIPDLLACYRGQFVFFESKLPGEWPTAIQSAVMDQLKAAGAIGGICVNVQMAMTYLDSVDRKLEMMRTGKSLKELLDT
jgi:hypothetical protein